MRFFRVVCEWQKVVNRGTAKIKPKHAMSTAMSNLSVGESLRISIVVCTVIGHEQVRLRWLRRIASACHSNNLTAQAGGFAELPARSPRRRDVAHLGIEEMGSTAGSLGDPRVRRKADGVVAPQRAQGSGCVHDMSALIALAERGEAV
jgi:hypothetical protein